jgi:carbamoyl-phosphate synthase small subunit
VQCVTVCPLAEDMESEKCHLGAIIVRDLSISVSNYRATLTLDEYCKQQGVMGIADVDTRALTQVSMSMTVSRCD